jgi:hypothetical protein
LRELLASGDVRAIRYESTWPEMTGPLEEPDLIKPSEWLKDQVDFEVNARPDLNQVDVSQSDLRYWLDKQPRRAEPTAERISRKRAWAEQAIKALWPKGIPEPLTNPQIERAVGDSKQKSPGIYILPYAIIFIFFYNKDNKYNRG